MIQDVLTSLRSERDRLDSAISALENLSVRPPKVRRKRKTSARKWSAAAKKRQSEMMKQRWASGKMK